MNIDISKDFIKLKKLLIIGTQEIDESFPSDYTI